MFKSWEQILGGYATDTLTEEEKRQLFEAALVDQTLFDALADEEALKALLANPEVKQRVLASLEAAGNSPEAIAASSIQKVKWFRQPSSLAWVGGIAAMGLAVIFGWQMEKDWGSEVQQEQERSIAKKKDEAAVRSQAPKAVAMKNPSWDAQNSPQKEPEQAGSVLSQDPSLRSPSTSAKAAKGSEHMRQSSAPGGSENSLRREVKKERRLKANESVPTPQEPIIGQNVSDDEPMVAPTARSPERIGKSLELSPQSPVLADELQEKSAVMSPNARELFYANKDWRVDDAEEEIEGRRAQHLLGGMSSQTEKMNAEADSDLKKTKKTAIDSVAWQNAGIRYNFVRFVEDGKDDTIDSTQYSGKWSELHLAIESNVSGYLYVLTSFGKGKWQWMRPKSSNFSRSSDGAIEVKRFQPVTFALSQVTNIVGRPVVSSISVALSSTPLPDLGQWFGDKVKVADRQVEKASHTVYAFQDRANSDMTLRVDIPLEE